MWQLSVVALARKAWALVCTPLGRRIALAIAAVLVILAARAHWLGAGHAAGLAEERKAEAVRLAAARKDVAGREVKAQAITTSAAAALTAERVRIVYRTQILTKEVPVYVTPHADADCVVPAGFVRLHDAAADPASLPGPAGGPLDAASGIPLSAVAETVIANYGAAYDWRGEALTWRGWYVRHKAAWGGP